MSERQHTVLPVEGLHRMPRRTIALTALVILLSAVLFNAGIQLLLRSRPNLDNRTYTAFDGQWRRLVDLDDPVETLILGDSSGRHGVDPVVLDVELATSSLNLCTVGDAAVINPAWQLETYVERHGAPRRVILVIVHNIWRRDMPMALLPRVPLAWGFWKHLRVQLSLSRAQTREVFLARHVPVYSQDLTVTELLMHPWRDHDRRLHFSPRGFSPIRKAKPEKAVADAAVNISWTASRGWHISGQSRRALMSMMELADESGFDFYITNSPQLAGMLDDPVFGPYYAEGQRVLGDLAAGSPRTHLIMNPPAEYAPEQMQNSDHIVAAVVEDYTQRIAAAVATCEERTDER